ncbi:hypothetical protein NEMBOFW57_003007 [Staphylotrichum longicolle]|uniref:Ppx/GppA phosphatase N-terminal domain-containing protein n=1 Tax=Staphylotrichum longicolle TaxID=669026 RepID=A0AAD4F4E2_9PEZI|nr:hypothetical protein NEMBOFW57_003007 [Staphylotrichum longicolle]
MDALVDIITLENLERKMPRWDPTSSNHLYALVDMGSNGIRFSISDLSPPRTRMLKCVYRERAPISLFDALSRPSLLFPDETITLVSQTLARFRAIAIDEYGVPPNQVRVFATEAMRRAQNATAMLEAIRVASPGLSVYILAPQVETLFGSVGARSGFVDVKGLFLDLGGGSVQMTYLDTYAAKSSLQEGHLHAEIAAALAGQSLPFGAARLIRVLENTDADTQAAQISQLRGGMSEAFRTLCARFPSLAATAAEAEAHGSQPGRAGSDVPGIDIYLCGGGFRGYGSMLMHNHAIQPYPIPSVGSFTVPGTSFCKTKEFLKLNRTFEGKIFGMSKRRRTQFPAIVAVVEALIAAVPPIRSVTFCAGGNREGALMVSLLSDIRESNPLAHSDVAVGNSVPLVPVAGSASVQDVLNALQSAFPPDLTLATSTTIFGLHIGFLYAGQIWTRLGDDDDTNASAALHNALHKNLQALMDARDPDATFWADYTGAVTAVMATLIRRWPKTPQAIKDNIRFRSFAEHGKKYKINLEIGISEEARKGVDLDNLLGLFKGLKKGKHDGKKVNVAVIPLE